MITQGKQGTKPIVIDPEHAIREKLSHSEHFVFRIDANERDRLRDTFLVIPSSTLNNYAELIIRSMKKLPKLRIVFVLMDTDFDSFFDKVAELKVSSLLAKIFRVDHPSQVDRILHAWCDGLERQMFADVRMEDSVLIAKACDLTRLEIDLSTLPVFRHMNLKSLPKPEIDRSGSKLFWNEQDIDIDFDTLRYHADHDYKVATDLAELEYYPSYGDAIRKFREQSGMTQEVVSSETGFSTRHLSRIENSEQKLTVKLMEALASAHGMSFDKYVKQLIDACSTAERAEMEQRRSKKR